MDEPASALDPIATAKIEELIHELKARYTIVIVTHNMQQAARVSDQTAFFYMGELVEVRADRADLHEPAASSGPRTTSPASSGRRGRASSGAGDGMATHTDKAYEAELKDLRDRLLEMGGARRARHRRERARDHRARLRARRAGEAAGPRDQPDGGRDRRRLPAHPGAPAAGGVATCASSPPRSRS